jgi:hypothetical protein
LGLVYWLELGDAKRARLFRWQDKYSEHLKTLAKALSEWVERLSFATCEYSREGFMLYSRSIPVMEISYLSEALKHVERESKGLDSFKSINDKNLEICLKMQKMMADADGLSFDVMVAAEIKRACPSIRPVVDTRDYKYDTYLVKWIANSIFANITNISQRNPMAEIRVVETNRGNEKEYYLQISGSTQPAYGGQENMEKLKAVILDLIDNDKLKQIVGEYWSLSSSLDEGRDNLTRELRNLIQRWGSGKPAERPSEKYPICNDCPPSHS